MTNWNTFLLFGLALALGTLCRGEGGRAQAADATEGQRAIGVVAEPLHDLAPAGNAALFIGINQFVREPNVNSLSFAVEDAVAQAHLFVEELKLVPAGNCYVALSGEPATDASKEQLASLERAGVKRVEGSRSAILDALLAVSNVAAREADLVLVSVSTHGFEEEGVPYVLVADGRLRLLKESALSVKTIHEQLEQSKAGKRLVLVDACRKNVTHQGKGGDDLMSDAFRNALAAARGIATLASCDAGQVSWENDKIKHGVFTHCLLQALHGYAAADSRGFVTFGCVSDYVRLETPWWLQRNRPDLPPAQVQRPWCDGKEGYRDIPLAVDKAASERYRQFHAGAEALAARLRPAGVFDAPLCERVANALRDALDDARGQELYKQASDFVEGRLSAEAFVGFLQRFFNLKPPAPPPTPPPSDLVRSLTLQEVDKRAGRWRLRGVILNDEEMSILQHRIEPLQDRLDVREVHVDAPAVAGLVQRELVKAGLRSVRVREQRREHGAREVYLRVTYTASPTLSDEQVKNLACQYVFRDELVDVVAYP